MAAIAEAKANNTGTGPCDMFSPSGKAVPARWQYQDAVIKGYQAQLAAVCRQFATCVYDNGALYGVRVTADDLAPDGEHLSIAGHQTSRPRMEGLRLRLPIAPRPRVGLQDEPVAWAEAAR